MDHIENKTERRILRSWKEIASYVGCGVRTVQRYERQLGLPVHRAQGKSHTSVIALADDLDGSGKHMRSSALNPRTAALFVLLAPEPE